MAKKRGGKTTLARARRLQAAPNWIAQYKGKNIVQGYARHFEVDLLCAIKELRLKSVDITDEYERELRMSLAANAKSKADRRREKSETSNPEPIFGVDYDDHHAHIMGFTSGGASFGITWEEAGSLNREVKNED